MLFISGLTLIIGPQKTFYFFARRNKLRGTVCFVGGVLLVFLKYPFVGMVVETFGFLNLFGCASFLLSSFPPFLSLSTFPSHSHPSSPSHPFLKPSSSRIIVRRGHSAQPVSDGAARLLVSQTNNPSGGGVQVDIRSTACRYRLAVPCTSPLNV